MEPIATRRLTWTDDAGTREVLVRIWAPVCAAGERNDWVCDFAIDGLPTPVRAHAAGIDSAQALQLAYAGVRSYLEPVAEHLSFLDERGEHHFPMFVNFYDSVKRRTLERLVDATIEKYVERQSRPKNRRLAKTRSRVDPAVADEDLSLLSTQELIDRIRIASAQSITFKAQRDRDAMRYFLFKQFPLFKELTMRQDNHDALRQLAESGDRALRLQAAQRLSEFDTTFLLQIRDEAIEPEASEAGNLLAFITAEATRKKPWDADY